jgi:hypothetical protein
MTGRLNSKAVREKTLSARHETHLFCEGAPMAHTNFKFQKRQKELDRKKKQDEKALRKQQKDTDPEAEAEAEDSPMAGTEITA